MNSSNSSEFPQSVDLSFPAQTENGEGITGYNYLHGTNARAGGFKVFGIAHVSRDKCRKGEGSVQFNLSFSFNDIVDPNPDYGTDIVKASIAHIITLGQAAPYVFTVRWSGTPFYQVKHGVTMTKGWPFKQG